MTEKEKGPDMPDWGALQTMWQDSPHVDMTKMARSARFVWWRMRINFASEILACFIGFGFSGFLLFGHESAAQVALALFLMVFCGLGFYAAFWVRRGAWGDPGGDALSLVRLKIRQAQSGVLYFKANVWLGIMALLLLPLAYWVVFDGTVEVNEARLHRLIIVVIVSVLAIVGTPIALWPYYKRKQREIIDLEEIAKQLDEEAGEEN